MERTCRRTGAWLRAMTMLPLALTLSISAMASDGALEREHLAGLARQIELADRLAEHAASTALQERDRYHFDYARLRADLQRVRTGVRDYLVPHRAQPRDPVPLAESYTHSSATKDKEGPSP